MEKGFWAVPKSIAKRKDLSFKAKLVAGVLGSMRDSKSEAFPSRRYMADALGSSRATIDRGIAELKESAGLKVKRRGFGKSNCYAIPDWLSEMTTSEKAEATTLEEAKLMATEGSRVKTIIDNINKYTNSDDKKSSVKEAFDYFRNKVREVKGFHPEIDWAKDGNLIKKRFKNYSLDEIKELIDWYLTSRDCERLGASLSICLSTNIINLWKGERSLKKPSDLSLYPLWKGEVRPH